jgi:DNA mismatch repair protein MutS2
MVTTHFSEIKTYALCDTASKLYAVRFDYETFTPKYDLIESVAGFSDPILIAKRLGFPDEIIRTAESNMAAIKTALEFGLEEVSLLKAEAVHKTRELEAKEALLSSKEGEIGRRDRELSERLAKREQELLEESYALLARSKRLAEQKLKAAPTDIQEDISKTASKIKALKEKKKPLENVKAGDTVFLEKFGKTAKILDTIGKKIVADVGGIRVNIAVSELFGHKTETPAAVPFKKSALKDQVIERNSANELVLVGKRVEEALDILDRYIDTSQYANYEKVYVIHGRGSGQLKRGVREFLRTCGRVKGYSPATVEDGGDAVTVVTL